MPNGEICGLIWNNVDQLSEGIKKFDTDLDYVAELSRLGKKQIMYNFTWDLVSDQYEIFYRG